MNGGEQLSCPDAFPEAGQGAVRCGMKGAGHRCHYLSQGSRRRDDGSRGADPVRDAPLGDRLDPGVKLPLLLLGEGDANGAIRWTGVFGVVGVGKDLERAQGEAVVGSLAGDDQCSLPVTRFREAQVRGVDSRWSGLFDGLFPEGITLAEHVADGTLRSGIAGPEVGDMGEESCPGAGDRSGMFKVNFVLIRVDRQTVRRQPIRRVGVRVGVVVRVAVASIFGSGIMGAAAAGQGEKQDSA